MKISFRARFRWKERYKDVYDEEALNDAFLVFLPRKLEIVEAVSSSYGRYYDIKMETDKVFTFEEIKEKLEKVGVQASDFTRIKREFTKKEQKEIKSMVCFKKIFHSSKKRKR